MPTFTFRTHGNSYFNGNDVEVEHPNGETAIVQIKDGMWAVNVKDERRVPEYPADVRLALANLPEAVVDSLTEQAKATWWSSADDIAKDHGFDGISQAGRSGGWAALDSTQGWDAATLEHPADSQQTTERDRFLRAAFALVKSMDDAYEDFYARMRAAQQELQIELSTYSDWVGAEVQGLDGGVAKVVKLEVQYGRAALRGADGMFTCATESKLVRKADGQVPARLTADPIMEQVFRIIEARSGITREQLDAFLDAEDDHGPDKLYEEFVGEAVNGIEDMAKEWAKELTSTNQGD